MKVVQLLSDTERFPGFNQLQPGAHTLMMECMIHMRFSPPPSLGYTMCNCIVLHISYPNLVQPRVHFMSTEISIPSIPLIAFGVASVPDHIFKHKSLVTRAVQPKR